MHENWDRLVGDLSERLQAAINSGDPTGLVDATALSQVQDLAEILTQDSRDAAAPDLIEALNVLVAVHWIRHQVLPEGQDQEDLQACQKWSATLLPLAPHLVPEPMRAYLVGSDMPVSNSVAEAHQRGAALFSRLKCRIRSAACGRTISALMKQCSRHPARTTSQQRSTLPVTGRGTVFSQDSRSGGQQCSPAGGHQLTSLPDGEPANTH